MNLTFKDLLLHTGPISLHFTSHVRSMPFTCRVDRVSISYLDASDLTIGASGHEVSHALCLPAAGMRTLFCFWCDFSFDAWAALMWVPYISGIEFRVTWPIGHSPSSSLPRGGRGAEPNAATG